MGIATAMIACILGVLQCFLLHGITQRVTKLKQGACLPFIIAKVLIYICIVVSIFTFMKAYVLYAAIGYPIGMLVTLIALTIINLRKTGDENK